LIGVESKALFRVNSLKQIPFIVFKGESFEKASPSTCLKPTGVDWEHVKKQDFHKVSSNHFRPKMSRASPESPTGKRLTDAVMSEIWFSKDSETYG